uniref:Uncharacterized protein n=1 Tax=Panagrolaimus sp. ES5 TaxID=591445 RepID=A0AC34G7V9_9BILA
MISREPNDRPTAAASYEEFEKYFKKKRDCFCLNKTKKELNVEIEKLENMAGRGDSIQGFYKGERLK